MPFCFQEYCEFLITEGREQPKEVALQDYIRWGGFPLVCKETNPAVKEVILANIYDSVILKDIILRNPVSSAPMLEKLIEYLIANSSCTISGNNIAKALSALYTKISAPTVYEYIKYITDACICSKVERYDIKGKKALAFQEKVYACDTGLLQLKKNRASQEFCKLIETVCHNELIARGYRVYVGKTRTGEVDFIAERGSEKFYLQATYLLATPEVVEREFGAYQAVQDNFPKYVVSMDPIQIQRDGIIHMSLMDFLSQPV